MSGTVASHHAIQERVFDGEATLGRMAWVRRPARPEEFDRSVVCRDGISALWPLPSEPVSHFLPERESVTVEIQSRIRAALAESNFEFRTIDGLAADVGVSQGAVKLSIAAMGDEVRTPLLARPNEENWFRLTSKGPTLRERFRVWRDMLTSG